MANPTSPESIAPEEWWTPVQVASFLGLQYQTARNQMLEGRFGESAYDPTTRKLTVLASRVRATKKPKRRKRRR